jgi:phosphate transport system permease protein
VLRKLIGQRKRFDVFFNILGITLIVCSLGVLGALGSKLFYDGGGRMLERYEVTVHNQAPGSRDLVGLFEAAPAEGILPAGYKVTPDPVQLVVAPGVVDVKPLVGQRVAVQGDLDRDGTMTVEAVRQIPAYEPGEEISGQVNLLGTILDTAPHPKLPGYTVAWINPEPLRVIPANTLSDGFKWTPDQWVGQRVTIDDRRGRDRKWASGVSLAKEVQVLQSQNFFTGMISATNPRETGIWPALIGTFLIMIVTAVITLPIGVAAGVYLEEYAPKNWFTNLIEINIANLAGVPSVIWGLLGLGLFVQRWSLGYSVLTAGLTLGLLVLPIIIIATRESIRAIPNTIREASIGLGATQWQTVRHHVLPYSYGGILTGAIIAMSRAVGETAPLVIVGALTYVSFTPMDSVNPISWLNSQYTVMPRMSYHWVGLPGSEWARLAAAAGLLLVLFTLSMNAVAIYLRYNLRKKIKW